MPIVSDNLRLPRPTDVRATRRFADIFLQALAAPDRSMKSLCGQLRWPEESGRRYRDGNASPDINRVLEASGRMPDDMVLELLRAIARGRFVIMPAEAQPYPDQRVAERVNPHVLVDDSVQIVRDAAELTGTVNDAAGDGQIDPGESNAIESSGNSLIDRIRRLMSRARRSSSSRH